MLVTLKWQLLKKTDASRALAAESRVFFSRLVPALLKNDNILRGSGQSALERTFVLTFEHRVVPREMTRNSWCPVFLNFSNLVSQLSAFEVLRLTWEIFHFQLGWVGLFTGTLLGAEGEREQVILLYPYSLCVHCTQSSPPPKLGSPHNFMSTLQIGFCCREQVWGEACRGSCLLV